MDVEEFLKNLANENKLKIYMFPDVPEGIPTDKSDIIKKGVEWTIDFGEGTLDKVEKYHPDVLDTVLKHLQEKNYTFLDARWKSRISRF